jgi:hypothetical protein
VVQGRDILTILREAKAGLTVHEAAHHLFQVANPQRLEVEKARAQSQQRVSEARCGRSPGPDAPRWQRRQAPRPVLRRGPRAGVLMVLRAIIRRRNLAATYVLEVGLGLENPPVSRPIPARSSPRSPIRSLSQALISTSGRAPLG